MCVPGCDEVSNFFNGPFNPQTYAFDSLLTKHLKIPESCGETMTKNICEKHKVIE